MSIQEIFWIVLAIFSAVMLIITGVLNRPKEKDPGLILIDLCCYATAFILIVLVISYTTNF